jgi:phage baseplate assembly protein gpV
LASGTCLGGSTIDVTADTVNVVGNVAVNGEVTVTGKVTADDNVIGGGKSLKTHKHGGVQVGGAQTGAPL